MIERADRILVTTHTRPDGDACGCMAAMTEVLRNLGKTVRPLLLSAMPDWYAFLFHETVPVLGKDLQVDQLIGGELGSIDLVIILDTNSYNQLPRFEDYLRKTGTPVLVIDHHVTSDGLGQVEVVDKTAAAAGLVLFDFVTHARWPITVRVAEALFVAIATDTGWFQLSNTDGRTHRRCADLLDLGVEPAKLYKRLYQDFSYARFQLMLAMLNRLELHMDGRYASQYLLLADFARTGAGYQDTENLINECHRIGSVVVSALFIELKDGRIRCSLRSRDDVDVSEIAAVFGGGGHKKASGTFLPGPMEHARQLIFDQVAARLSP